MSFAFYTLTAFIKSDFRARNKDLGPYREILLHILLGRQEKLANDALTAFPRCGSQLKGLSGFDIPEYVQRALEVGAKGYVLKDAASEDLLKAIHVIHGGSHYFSEKIAETAKRYLACKGNASSAA